MLFSIAVYLKYCYAPWLLALNGLYIVIVPLNTSLLLPFIPKLGKLASFTSLHLFGEAVLSQLQRERCLN